jgi:hypothetical protein
MASQHRPLNKGNAPDTATSYERAKPENEAGMGRLDNNDDATPTHRPDRADNATPNKQIPEHQLNAEDVVDSGAKKTLGNSRH